MSRLLEPRRVAVFLGATIALFGLVGVVQAWSPQEELKGFDLDEERTLPALFSALLLVACAVLAWRLPRSVVSRPVAIGLAALLVLASLDELAELHERLERRSGVDWQLLYIPVFVAAVVLLASFVAGLRRNGLDLRLVLASAACWGVSQVLEALQWEEDGRAAGYTWMMVTEETLEMAGSALLLLSFLTTVRIAGDR